MKMSLNLAVLLFLGLFIAILWYPFLHELGHGMVAVLVGASIEDFRMFPVAYVLCNVYGIGDFGQVLIGISGMLFPFICGIIINCKNFWLWYVGLVLNIIPTIAFTISIVGCFLFEKNPIQNDDITQILNINAIPKIFWIIVFSVLIIWSVFRIINSCPITRCDNYFFKSKMSDYK